MLSVAPGMRVSLTAMVPSFGSVKAANSLPNPIGWRPAMMPRGRACAQRHELRDRRETRGLLGRATPDARGAEEHDSPGRLIGKALEETMDDEPAETMAEEMHRGRLELAHEAVEVRGDLAHAG